MKVIKLFKSITLKNKPKLKLLKKLRLIPNNKILIMKLKLMLIMQKN